MSTEDQYEEREGHLVAAILNLIEDNLSYAGYEVGGGFSQGSAVLGEHSNVIHVYQNEHEIASIAVVETDDGIVIEAINEDHDILGHFPAKTFRFDQVLEALDQ